MKKVIFSVHEKHQANRRWSGCYCAGMNIIYGSEVANLPKILNGPQGNEACQTATFFEMLDGLEKPPANLRIIPI